MIQKCNGIKILDLESKEKTNGSEYTIIAEKDNNYKLPISQLVDTVISSSKFKAAVSEVYESSVPTASVTLEEDQFLFSFGIPAGRKGDPGRDGINGKDGADGKNGIDGVPGVDGDTTRVVIAYKSTKTTDMPDIPVGGSWDYVTNTITYPDGWSGSDYNPNGYIWMSTATFSSRGTIIVPWNIPIRLTGDNGTDGVDGTSIEFVYKLTLTSLVEPTKPEGNTQASAIEQGWTDHPTGISEEYQCEWVCSHNMQTNGIWSEWSGPTVWSKWGIMGKDGDGVEYIFQRTTLPAPPKDITDNNPDVSEYIPESAAGEQPWTDNPSGVDPLFQYEWVSQRKYKGDTKKWGNFSSPSLWAKYSVDGTNGHDGNSIRVMYTKTSNSGVKPRDPDRTNINPGSIWGVGMPTATSKEAIWGIQALVTYDNEIVIDTTLPENEQGWQGPYLITGVPGLDGNNFNYQVDAYKLSESLPNKPTSTDPYNPGDGWILNPDQSNGTWWKCTANVQGETGIVIEWGAVIKVTGSGINIIGTLNSVDDLPTTNNKIGDGYIIDGNLWTWNGSEWVNVGKIQGPPGPPGSDGADGSNGADGADGADGVNGNYVEYRFARNDSWENAPSLQLDVRYPSGWSVHSPALSDGKVLWATFATINGTDNTLSEEGWADPYYMTGMTGNSGSGIPGVGYEIRYCKGTETTYTGEAWSDTMKRKRIPDGWSLDVPELTNGDEYNYIWFIQVRIIDDALESNSYWSKPNPMGGIITPTPIGEQPIAYPAGIYSVNTHYINDGEKAPYVYDTNDGNYYFLKEVMTWLGTLLNNVSPSTDTSGAWTVLEGYEAIYTDLLIAPNSLVGGAVFNNNLMFSLKGKDANNENTSLYLNINTEDPMNTSNSFRPNFLLNFADGEAYFGAGNIHLSANENTSILLKNTSTLLTLNKSGVKIERTPPSGAISSVPIIAKIDGDGMYSTTLDGNLLTDFSVDSNGISASTKTVGVVIPGTTVNILHLKCNIDGSGSLANNGIYWNSNGDLFASTIYETIDLSETTTIELPTLNLRKSYVITTPIYSRNYTGHTINGNYHHIKVFASPTNYGETPTYTTYEQGSTITLSGDTIYCFTGYPGETPYWNIVPLFKMS